MAIIYIAFCSRTLQCSTHPLFHILLDPEVNIGGLHLENLCSHYVAGKKVRQRENPNHTEVAEICF